MDSDFFKRSKTTCWSFLPRLNFNIFNLNFCFFNWQANICKYIPFFYFYNGLRHLMQPTFVNIVQYWKSDLILFIASCILKYGVFKISLLFNDWVQSDVRQYVSPLAAWVDAMVIKYASSFVLNVALSHCKISTRYYCKHISSMVAIGLEFLIWESLDWV